MSFNAPQQQEHSEPPITSHQLVGQDTADGGCCQLVSRESLIVALDFDADGKNSLQPSKSWGSLPGFSEESTLSLTDCSSRSSLQDLDLSFEEFKDPLPSPDLRFWKRLDDDDIRKSRHPFLPSVLRKASQGPRAVSFSAVEEVFGEEEEGGIRPPKTPSIAWYSSKGSSQKPRENRHQVPMLSSCSPLRKPPLPKQQPRRSALKKADSTPPVPFLNLHYPASPKVTWYSSKKR